MNTLNYLEIRYHDPDGFITCESIPAKEYLIYKKCWEDVQSDNGCYIEKCECEEPCFFTLEDFKKYISDKE